MKEITIGRLPENNITISENSVSRNHAKIVQTGAGTYEIVDLNSTCGTYVNGRKVRGQMSVRPGDRIVIATTPLTANWKEMFDSMPDDKPAPVYAPAPEAPKQAPPSSVLYDFSKNVDEFFTKEGERLKQIITDFKNSQLPSRRRTAIRHFSEDVLDLLIERYDFVGMRISALLKKIED